MTTPAPQNVPTISLTFALCQCQALAAGEVSDEMREYFRDAAQALQETPAESMKRRRARKDRAAA